MERFEMAQWGWSLIQSERVREQKGAVTADIRHLGNGISGTISNGLDVVIRDAFIVTTLGSGPQGQASEGMPRIIDIGDLPPGRLVELGPRVGPPIQILIASTDSDYSNLTSSYARFRAAITQSFAAHLAGSPLMPGGRVFLFGFVERDNDRPVKVPLSTASRSHVGVLALHVPIRPEPGVVYPYGHMVALPVSRAGTGRPRWGDGRNVIESGAITMQDSELGLIVESPFALGSGMLEALSARIAWNAGRSEDIQWETTYRDAAMQRRRVQLSFAGTPANSTTASPTTILDHLVPDVMKAGVQAWPLTAINADNQAAPQPTNTRFYSYDAPTIRSMDFAAQYR
jgi:hypothetical protein